MRLLKQLLYGLFYLVIFAGLGYVVLLVILKPVPSCFDNLKNQNEEDVDCGDSCIPCALKNIQSVQYSLQSLPLGGIDGPTNVIITFSNPNSLYGASDFSYELIFQSLSGAVKSLVTRNSFIYPGEKNKVVVEPNLDVSPEAKGKFEIVLRDPVWALAEEFKKPNTQPKEVRTAISGSQIMVSGFLANAEAASLSRAVVHVLVKEGDLLIGASKTVLVNLKPFEERQFILNIPVNRSISSIDRKNLRSEVFIEALK